MTTTTNPKAPKRFFAGISGIKSGVANIIDAGKTFKTLGPSQVKDEIQIAKHELKTKGIAVGKGAAFFGVAAVFGLFLIIALVAAAILGLGTVMPYWASALVFALIFLIVLAICALVGLKKVKAQLPFKPESAIFGLLFDLGVLKEGTAMSAERLKKEQAERAEQKAKEAEEAAERARQEAEERKARGEEEPKPPTFEELKQRTAEGCCRCSSYRPRPGRECAQARGSAGTLEVLRSSGRIHCNRPALPEPPGTPLSTVRR